MKQTNTPANIYAQFGPLHAYSALVLVLVLIGYVTYLLVRKIGTNNSAKR